MLRSVLVTTFSAVAAFGTLSGLSGVMGEAHEASSAQSSAVMLAVTAGAETSTGTDDSVWD
jgi:hypothetical protein